MNISATSSLTALADTGQTRPAGPPHGGPHGAGGPGGPEKGMQKVAELLDMDTDELKAALDSGKTMAELAESAGVSRDDLVATIEATLPATGPDGTATDTATMAANIADGVRPQHHHARQTSLEDGVDALSSALGVSSDDLLQRLTSDRGIADLLKKNPEVAARLDALQSTGVLVDNYA